jgi:hypothetical protein
MKSLFYLFLLTCAGLSNAEEPPKNRIAQVLWPNQNLTVTCEVLEQRLKGEELPNRELLFIDSKGNHIQVISTPDRFLSMFPIGDKNALFVSVWLGGSAYHIRVFCWKDNKPTCVLDDGSKAFPEITFDLSGINTFFFLNDETGGPDDLDNWTTKCFRWDDHKMVFVKKLPARTRFEILHDTRHP